jgi:hypothetical protein
VRVQSPLLDSVQAVRAPRLQVLINGQPLVGTVEAGVTTFSRFRAGSFQISAVLAQPEFSFDFWITSSEITVEILVAADGSSGLYSIIEGKADQISVDPVRGLVRISGRDYTSVLLDSNTQEVFVNRTASELAISIATRRGLVPLVSATTDMVGRQDNDGHTYSTFRQFSRTLSEWDILVDLAVRENYDVFVAGKSLCFQPSGSMRRRFNLNMTAATGVRVERLLPGGADISVIVQSWDCREQAMVQEVVGGSESQNSGLQQPAARRTYIVMEPNLSAADAARIAKSRLAEFSSYKTTCIIDMPGELTLTARDEISLIDQAGLPVGSFEIEAIDRRFHPISGYTQRIRTRSSAD